MKRLILLSVITFSFSVSAQERKIHTPAEMIKIATESKLTYNIGFLENPIVAENYENNLLQPEYYRVEQSDKIIVRKYDLRAKAKAFFEAAETEFQANKLPQALENYLLAYKEDSTFSLALSYAGQVCEHSGNYTDAEKYLKKAVSQNYIDYMAHWFLADVYEHNGALQKAKQEILVAHILNRNNPRIMTALKRILTKVGDKYNSEWVFNPQVEVLQTDSGINVKYNDVWLGYAIAKALWQFEPGYKENMGIKKDADINFNQDAEKEALISVLIMAENEKKKKLPESINALQKATKNKMFQEYLFYEIWLTKRPDIALQLPNKFIKEISDYVLKIRCSTN